MLNSERLGYRKESRESDIVDIDEAQRGGEVTDRDWTRIREGRFRGCAQHVAYKNNTEES